MDSTKYIGMDVHKESISIAVMDCFGKVVMESVIETKASTIAAIEVRSWRFIVSFRFKFFINFLKGTSLYCGFLQSGHLRIRFPVNS